MKIYKNIVVFLVCVLSFPAFTQPLRFKHITGEDGLSSNFVHCIIQDDKGFMWFGTQDGLNKYDGYSIKPYKVRYIESDFANHSGITTLEQVKPNLILVGTNAGLVFFNPVTERFNTGNSKVKLDCLNNRINAILQLDSSQALIGTDKGLFKMNFNTGIVIKVNLTTDENFNVSCFTKTNGKVLIGTSGKGLWKIGNDLKPEKVELLFPADLKLKPTIADTITCIRQYAGAFYLGTDGHGVVKTDQHFEVESLIRFRNQNAASDVIYDFFIKNNRIFAATPDGVFVYNLISEKSDAYTNREFGNGLNAKVANCIISDDQNNLWVGTDLGGINVSFFRSQKFPVAGYETSLKNIYAFCETTKGSVLIGGTEVLYEINLENGKQTSHSKLLGNSTVLCIEKESDTIYWIGTWGKGIYRYDRLSKSMHHIETNKNVSTILCLKIIGKHLYAGTHGDGLLSIDLVTQKLQSPGLQVGLAVKSINTIFTDSKNNIWLGTHNEGLLRLNNISMDKTVRIEQTFKANGKADGLASNTVYGINEDNKGFIWAATSRGLGKLLANGSFINYNEKKGLSSSFLHSILKDSVGNFWLSSNKGIVRFNPSLPEKDLLFRNYGTKDGLINATYNMGSAYISQTGYMYFGGPRGFNVFRPSGVKDNYHMPPVYVSGYRVSGKVVHTDTAMLYKKLLSLKWPNNSFQFELVALDFSDPDKNKFRYKLEGINEEWSEPSNVRYVSYTEIPGGDYVFKVKACNNDGVWNERPFELRVSVRPAFWHTNLFYSLLVFIGIGTVAGIVRLRTNFIQNENRILESRIAERTRELEEKNQDIMSSIHYAKRIQEAILPPREEIFRKLKKVFILYKPKDIVSGDFYWFAEKNGVNILAVVDCTGHGVPGAFMSMIGHNLLHQIVLDKGITDPGKILDHLNAGVLEALRQEDNEVETDDGMDVSIICIDYIAKTTKWAGANRPLLVIENDGVVINYAGNKFPVGGTQTTINRIFTTNDIIVKQSATAYLFSDGYADQFGGEKGKKYMVRNFYKLLMSIHQLSPDAQQKKLEDSFEAWRHNREQVDDVLIAGIQLMEI